MTQLSSNKVAQHLDISVTTLNNWYHWYENKQFEKPADMPELPAFSRAGARGPRYWNSADLPKLEAFRDWLPKGRGGVMGDWNARFWGARGQRAIKNKKAFRE